jgi:putative hemolysin
MNIRNIALIGLFVGMLAACASPVKTQPDVAQPTATQPESTQPAIANPASQNCVDQGGILSF